MSETYDSARRLFLRQARTIIETTEIESLPIGMMHHVKDLDRNIGQCTRAAQDMGACLKEAIEKLEQGTNLRDICDPEGSPHYKPHSYPESPAGGKASAIGDVAVLIATLDPSPFSIYASGGVEDDILSHLNSTLHLWLLELQKEWNALRQDIDAPTEPLFATALPPPETEKATLGVMFSALCHSLHIGPERPSPYLSIAAAAFSGQFAVKLWPHGGGQPENTLERGCILTALSTDFQEWYFSVGKTQTENPTRQAARRAEDVFVDLRTQFHTRGRQCQDAAGQKCGGSCIAESFAALADDPFKERCRLAVKHIVLQLQKP